MCTISIYREVNEPDELLLSHQVNLNIEILNRVIAFMTDIHSLIWRFRMILCVILLREKLMHSYQVYETLSRY